MARKKPEKVVLTKAQLAARERKRAAKKPKNVYDAEKMKLNDAITVLRVCCFAYASAWLPLMDAAGGRGRFPEFYV